MLSFIRLFLPVFVLLSALSALSAQTAATDEEEPVVEDIIKENRPAYARKGSFEAGGRIEFEFSRVNRDDNRGTVSAGSLLLAPQLGYFIIDHLELSVYPVYTVRFEEGKEPDATYGSLLAPAWVFFASDTLYPYIELLGGGSLNATTRLWSFGGGGGLKITFSENGLLKVGLSYTRRYRESRLPGGITETEDRLRFTTGFGIYF